MVNDNEKDVFWPWFTTKEAAWHLRITPNALRILVHRKKVKAYKMGNRLRFKRTDLQTLIQERVLP